MKKVLESIEFELLKNENDYCGIIDLMSGIKGCNTENLDMFKIIKSTKEGLSLNEILSLEIII